MHIRCLCLLLEGTLPHMPLLKDSQVRITIVLELLRALLSSELLGVVSNMETFPNMFAAVWNKGCMRWKDFATRKCNFVAV
jgi:hypothetical protein